MPEAMRDLLAAAAEPPTRPVDPVALRRRAHRRSRTAGAGAASLALVLVSVVAVAGLERPGLSRVALEEEARRPGTGRLNPFWPQERSRRGALQGPERWSTPVGAPRYRRTP